MKLFKKHYEKFIFIILLLLFVALFGIQTYSVISSQDETPDEKLQINLGRPDYKPINFNEAERFRATVMFRNASERIDALDKGNNDKEKDKNKNQDVLHIDVLVPPQLAKCPEGIHLIPITDFPAKKTDKNKKCSFCNTPLKEIPMEIQMATIGGGRDSDNDGIPDADEIKNGLDSKNPNDAMQDRDNDGFTNLEEFREKTEINNPKSRPRYAKKLYVKEIREKKIGIYVKQVTGDERNQKNPERWTIHFNYKEIDKRGKERMRAARLRLGRELKRAGNNSDDFLVKQIIPKFGDMDGKQVNQSTVILERVSDKLAFTVKVGEEVTDPHKEVTFEIDLPFLKEKEIHSVIGKEFKIGTTDTEIDTFITKQATINPNAEKPEDRQIVRIQLKSSGEPFTIKMKENASFGGGEGMFFPEGMPRGGMGQPNTPRFRTPQF